LKLITSIFGSAIVRATPDEVIPEAGIVPQDVFKFIGDAYSFANRPALAPTTPLQINQIFTFQQGKLAVENSVYPIQQLSIFLNGDAVSAQNTDAADTVLTDFMRRLNEKFQYRYEPQSLRRSYVSGLVVQFDRGLEEYIAAFQKIGEILDREIPRPNFPFKPKILIFGNGDPSTVSAPNSLEDLAKLDFVLQRRLGEPYTENRYYSSAPLRTVDHLKMLQSIEEALRN
jgi:hypothetical protein